MINSTLQNFYCSEKFTWLSVDFEKRQSYSCCAATPHAIDLNWIKQNPGQLFNTPHLIEERQTMLAGQPVASCQSPCWQPESQNMTSRRMLWPTQEKLFKSKGITAMTLNTGKQCFFCHPSQRACSWNQALQHTQGTRDLLCGG